MKSIMETKLEITKDRPILNHISSKDISNYYQYQVYKNQCDFLQTYLVCHDPYKAVRVIRNGPATIVFWNDGSKTVVKCQDDDNWDIEKAVAMCFVKKYLGNKGNYYNQIRDAIDKCEEGDE